MKSSTITLLLAVVLFLGALTFYNFSLKAAYLTGNYKSQYPNRNFTPLKGLNILDIPSANLMYLRIEQGTQEGIWLSPGQQGRLNIIRHGDSLSIDFLSKEIADINAFRYEEIIIIVNNLQSLRTNDYDLNTTDESNYGGSLDIRGVHERQLTLALYGNTSTTLQNSSIGTLKVSLGQDKKGANLTLAQKNQIDTAYFNVKGQSSLSLSTANIGVAHYQMSKNSSIQMSGDLLHQLSK